MSVSISPPMFLQFFNPNNSGAPAAGYKLFTYVAGTSTKQATWTDSTQTSQNSNPIILDSTGAANVWLDPTLFYKFVFCPPNDTDPPTSPIRSTDNISGSITAAVLTQTLIGTILYPRTTAEIAAAVTPTLFYYPPLDPLRYGVIGDGVTNDTAAWARWKSVVQAIPSNTPGPMHAYGMRADASSTGFPQTALQNLPQGNGLEHTAYGQFAGQALTTGSLADCAIGYSAMAVATTPQFMTSVGVNSSLFYTTGLGFNTIVGYGAYARALTGFNNVAVGFEALHDNAAGTDNTALGTAALHSGTNGSPTPAPSDPFSCVGVGSQALKFNYGSSNTVVGNLAMTGVSTASYSSGGFNTVMGTQAMTGSLAAAQNVAIGYQAGFSNVSANSCVMIGYQSGQNLASGTGLNIYIGQNAGFWNTTATQNVAVGSNALSGTNGSNGGGGNTAIGDSAMQLCGVAGQCTAVGQLALRVVTTGTNNVAVGASALVQETTGTNLTACGTQAGATQTVGFTNSHNFGYQANSTGSNQVTLGNSSIATLRCQQTTITALSDARFKEVEGPLDLPNGFLDEVQVVAYRWIEGRDLPPGRQVGVIAQHLDELQTKYGVEWLGLVDKSNPDRWEATPGKLLFPLIQRVQRQEQRLQRIEALLAL